MYLIIVFLPIMSYANYTTELAKPELQERERVKRAPTNYSTFKISIEHILIAEGTNEKPTTLPNLK